MTEVTPKEKPSFAYSGRFAPSPTGPLHFDHSLLPLPVIVMQSPSWNMARSCRRHRYSSYLSRQWRSYYHITGSLPVRTRCRNHLSKNRLDIYESVLDQLKKEGLVYACQCTRKMLGSNAIYAGTCRNLNLDFQGQAIRVKFKISKSVLMTDYKELIVLICNTTLETLFLNAVTGLLTINLA